MVFHPYTSIYCVQGVRVAVCAGRRRAVLTIPWAAPKSQAATADIRCVRAPPPPHTHTPLCLPHISRDRSRSRSMTPDGGYRPRKRQEAPKAAGEGGGEGIIKGGAWFSWVPPTQGVG
jgi:hypothetical protein